MSEMCIAEESKKREKCVQLHNRMDIMVSVSWLFFESPTNISIQRGKVFLTGNQTLLSSAMV